ELYDLAETVHADATQALADQVTPLPGGGPDLVVLNSSTWERRVEEILGRSLDDPDVRMELWLALKATAAAD
ncbi:helix-turn-helix domain-containing protein, partial [Streptomyces phyllanthi]|uniref:helix-turn-helix domain-containing protein n=1 Tax=Streptomyces phyllanthi TaxID=1803180 RepID=UPI001D14D22F